MIQLQKKYSLFAEAHANLSGVESDGNTKKTRKLLDMPTAPSLEFKFGSGRGFQCEK